MVVNLRAYFVGTKIRRVGTLTFVHKILPKGVTTTSWHWVGPNSLGPTQGFWEWEYDQNLGMYKLNLRFDTDPTILPFGVLTDAWYYPKFGSEPAQPWFSHSAGHSSGDLLIRQIYGVWTTYTWRY